MNPAAEGTVYPDVPFTVDTQRVTAAEFTVFPNVINDPNLGLDFTRVLHGSQEYTYERPLREGETIMVRARIDSIRHKGGTGFLTIVMELRDDDGRLVCTARSQMVEQAP